MRVALVPALAALLLLAPACQMNERMTGTAFGAGGGAVIGGVLGGAGGAVAGGVLGGIAGYIVGDYIADQRERGRPSVFGNAPAGQVGGHREVAPVPAPVPEAQAAYERGRRAATAGEARRWYAEAARLDPRQPAPWNALGLNALLAGDREAAEAHFARALALDPDYYPARYNLARLRGEPLP